MEQTVRIDGDKCYVDIPMYGDYYKSQVVMTKVIFIECYNRWIKGDSKE